MLAIMTFVAHRKSSPGLFFLAHNHKLLPKGYFASEIREILRTAGFPQGHYAGHSFHIGPATTVALAGIADSTIQTVQRCIPTVFMNAKELVPLSAKMSSSKGALPVPGN